LKKKNKADSLIYSTQKSVREHGDKIASAEKEEVDSAIKSLQSALSNEDIDDINHKIEHLTQVSMKISQQAYGAKQQPESSQSASGEKTDGK